MVSKKIIVVLHGFPNTCDALGLFCRATYGAQWTFRADAMWCLRPRTEARIWVDVFPSVIGGSWFGCAMKEQQRVDTKHVGGQVALILCGQPERKAELCVIALNKQKQ